jgi:hypothetical protein
MPKKCYQCEQENPDHQSFCGSCGSPLLLADFLSKKVSEQLSATIKDRSVVETESAIRVFERAWGWVKIVGGIAAILLAIVGAGVFWQVSDFWSSVNKAKQSVSETARTTREQIDSSSEQFLTEIKNAAESAKQASDRTSNTAKQETDRITRLTAQTSSSLATEAAGVRKDVAKSREELAAVNRLRPEIENIRQGLTRATTELQDQQRVLSSSEDFVKHVFSSHQVDVFNIAAEPPERYGIISAPVGGKTVIVYLLLKSAPVANTLQLQFHIYTQPANSYWTIHNLVIFFWGDSVETLKQHQLLASYFPDASDKELIRSLSERDGRTYADGEPLPKFNQPDPDYQGSRWFKVDAEHRGFTFTPQMQVH